MSAKEYAEGFGLRDTVDYAFKDEYFNAHLFALIPQSPEPENSIHLGWNKTRWHCKAILPALFIPYKLLEFIHVIGSAG